MATIAEQHAARVEARRAKLAKFAEHQREVRAECIAAGRTTQALVEKYGGTWGGVPAHFPDGYTRCSVHDCNDYATGWLVAGGTSDAWHTHSCRAHADECIAAYRRMGEPEDWQWQPGVLYADETGGTVVRVLELPAPADTEVESTTAAPAVAPERPAPDRPYTLTFPTAAAALKHLRRHVLGARVVDALWTDTDAAIAWGKNPPGPRQDRTIYFLCSDGVFRPEILLPGGILHDGGKPQRQESAAQ